VATDTIEGAGLSNCNSTTSKLTWNSSTKKFGCGIDGTGSGIFVVKTKNANQAVTNSTVLVEDPYLFFGMKANQTWIYRIIGAVRATAGTPGLRLAIGAPTGSTCQASAYDIDSVIPSKLESTCGVPITGLSIQSSDTSTMFEIFGSIATGVNSGSGVLRWAQSTANVATTTMLSGSVLIAFKTRGSDLAEVYQTKDPSVLAGTVVSIDPTMVAGVRKSAKPYDSGVLGVISTEPAMRIGGQDLDGSGMPVFLALLGRIPVMVSDENGPIRPGDLLTSSSTPGVAMRATKPGAIIGQALTGFGGKKFGVVTVFIKNPVGESLPK
jgi:hypothetical protein